MFDNMNGSGRGRNTIQQVINSINLNQEAEVRRSSDLRPRLMLRMNLDLSVAATAENPVVVPNPFNGFYVESTSGVNVAIRIGIGGVDKYTTDNAFVVKRNSSLYSPTEVKQAVLLWPAQATELITIVFFLGIDFRPGSYISELTGNITVSSGNSLVTGTLGSSGIAGNVTVTSASAIMIAPQNLNRSSMTFYTDQAIWVGDSNVAANNGVYVPGGSSFLIGNTAEIYARAAGATATVSGIEESA